MSIIEITPALLLRFLAGLFYMGIVSFPTKRDYWPASSYLPDHTTLHGIPRAQFEFVWRNLHFRRSEPPAANSDVDEQDSNINSASGDPRPNSSSDSNSRLSGENADSATVTNWSATSQLWFDKVFALINQVRNVSLRLLVHAGTAVSVDEMMVKLKGRTAETHRIKNKAISEGYKLFALCDSKTGNVCFITPDGRAPRSSGGNEFSYRTTQYVQASL